MGEYSKDSRDMFLDWDDVIEDDGKEFILLEEGDYNFEVTGFERGRHPGSAKIPPCNKATLTLQVETEGGVAVVRTDLLLYRSVEWRICAFFRSIGKKKQGERLVMDWNKVIGSRGRARFKQRSYMGKDNKERFTNEVARFYDYDEKHFPKAAGMDDWMKVPDGEALPWE